MALGMINNAGYGLFGTIEEVSEAEGRAQIETATRIPAYDGARAAIAGFRSTNSPGDPDATGPAILKVVDAEDPPLRIFFGTSGLPMTRAEYARRLETWEKWNAVSIEAQGDLAAKLSR